MSGLPHGSLPAGLLDCFVTDTFSVGYLLLSCYFAVVWVLLLHLSERQFRYHNHLQFVNLFQVVIVWLLAEAVSFSPLASAGILNPLSHGFSLSK